MKKLISMLFMAVLAVWTMTGCKEDETVLQKFTVTFDSQGGSEVASQSVYAGEKIVKPESPTKENEYFVDWYKEAECTNVWDFENETVSQDITLYAKWTSIAYTVTFETNGGSAIEAQVVAEGTFATKPETVPTKEGYLFEGWYTEQTMTNIFDFYTPITTDITLYAKWLDISSITFNDLQNLFYEAENLTYQEYAYTEESLLALKEKVEEVRPIVDNSSSTQEEIATAYQTLHTALQALVELPYRQTSSLEIYPTPTAEGFIPVYLSQMRFSLWVTGLDSNGNPSSHPDIKIEFDGNEMNKWGDYYYGNEYLSISNLKSTIKSGTTVDIKIICNDNPSLSTTITLKAIDAEEQKAMFINAVDAFPEEVTFDNCLEAFNMRNEIWDLYSQLPPDLQSNPDIQAAYQKLNDEIELQIWRYTIYTAYKFDGNTCTLTSNYGSIEICEYTAEGNFPYGTYTGEWIYDGYSNTYSQSKIELKSDNTYQRYWRTANSEAEKETAEWFNSDTGTYKLTGDQTNGGSLILRTN